MANNLYSRTGSSSSASGSAWASVTGKPGTVYVKADFGATGDGTTNDRTAIANALTAGAGGHVHFEGPADYLISSAVTVPADTLVTADRDARVFGAFAGGLVNVQSGAVLDGLTLQATAASSQCVNVNGSSSRIRLYRLTLKGTNGHGIYVGSAGCSDIGVYDCTFDQCNYGWLSNAGTGTGAWDLRDVTIANCRFSVISDAVEFNHPTSAAAVAGGFTVIGCSISVPDRAGAGASTGFGIGMANVRDVLVTGNRLETIRNQGIHVEDDCADVIISNNTIKNVDGTLAGLSTGANVGVSVAKSTNVTVTGNQVDTARGAGFLMVHDGTTVNNQLSFAGNSATACLDGFYIYGQTPAAHVLVVNNRAYSNSRDGISIGASLSSVTVRGNHCYSNGGWGIFRAQGDRAYLHIFRDNLLYGNTSGDINGEVIPTGAATLLYDKAMPLSGTSSGGFDHPNTFRLGSWAQGKITVSLVVGSDRKEITQDVLWNGTTLKTATLRQASSGTIDVSCYAMVNGVLQLEVFTGTGTALAWRATIQFDGLLHETSATFSGTVTATALATLDDKQPLDSDLTTIAGLTATTDNLIQSVGSAWASRTPAQVKTALSLNNVDNTADTAKPVSTATQTALNSKADLVGGTVPSGQLPSYVDDVVEAANFAALPGTGETGKIYVTLDDGKTFRWSGSAYVEISASLALGETSATAYRGDRGATAYDHSQITSGNPHGVTAATISDFSTASDARISAAVGASVEAHDTDLSTIAGLSPSNDDVIQRKAGAWTNRTPAQVKTDLALVTTDVGLQPLLTTGQETLPRQHVLSTGVTMSTGVTRFAFMTARKTETITQIRMCSATTAAGATPTLVRFGLYSVDGSGNLTLMSAITSDTAIFAATSTAYTRSLAASQSVTAGSRYAIGALVVTSFTAPIVSGMSLTLPTSETGLSPALTKFIGSQTDLQSSYTAVSLGDSAGFIYAVLVP